MICRASSVQSYVVRLYFRDNYMGCAFFGLAPLQVHLQLLRSDEEIRMQMIVGPTAAALALEDVEGQGRWSMISSPPCPPSPRGKPNI